MGKKYLVNGIVFNRYPVYSLNRKGLKICMGFLIDFLKNFRQTKILKNEFIGKIGQKGVKFQVKCFSNIKDILFLSLTFLPGCFIVQKKLKIDTEYCIKFYKRNKYGSSEKFFWEIFYCFLKLIKNTNSLKVLLIIGKNLVSKYFKVTFFTIKLKKKIFDLVKKNQSLEVKIHSLLLLKEIYTKTKKTKKKKVFEQIFSLKRFVKEKEGGYIFFRLTLEIFSILPKKEKVRFIRERKDFFESQREIWFKKRIKNEIRENLYNLKFFLVFILEKFQKNLVLVYIIFFNSIWKSFFNSKKTLKIDIPPLRVETFLGDLNRHIMEINTSWFFSNSLRCMELIKNKKIQKKYNTLTSCIKIEDFLVRQKRNFMLNKNNWCKNFVLLKNFEKKGIDRKNDLKRKVNTTMKILIVKYYISSDSPLKVFQ